MLYKRREPYRWLVLRRLSESSAPPVGVVGACLQSEWSERKFFLRVLKKMWGGERMRSYSGLWDRQTYRSQEINVGTKGPRMKWMANPVGIACEPWKWLKWNGACVCEPWKWLKWNGARVWAVKVAQIKWIFWHLKMWGSGEFLLSETMRGFEFECYLGLNACVAWLLSTEYLERFTAILPLENVSLLPATTRDRWQYIRGQMKKKFCSLPISNAW